MKKISKDDFNRISRNIIKKLYSHCAFEKGHMLYERLSSGIPSHLSGYTSFVLKYLIKQEYVKIYGNTKHGTAYQLNIKRLKDIEKIIAN